MKFKLLIVVTVILAQMVIIAFYACENVELSSSSNDLESTQSHTENTTEIIYEIKTNSSSFIDNSTMINETNDLKEPINIEMKTYINIDEDTNTNIQVEYVRISGLSNKKIEKEINDLLRESAKFERYLNNYERISYTVDSSYSIFSNRLLSVKYDTFYNHLDAIHPYGEVVPITIDLKTGKELTISDIFAVDSDFINMIKNGEFIENHIASNELEKQYEGTYGSRRFYLTKSAFGITMDNNRHTIAIEVSIDKLTDIMKPEYYDIIFENIVN